MQFFPFLNTDAVSSGLDANALGRGASSRLDSLGEDARAQFASLLDDELAAVQDDVPGREEAVRSMWAKARSGVQALASERLLHNDFATRARTAAAAQGASSRNASGVDLGALISGRGAVSGVGELSGLRMTREDLLALQDGLKAYGLSKADVQALDERISSQGGLSWGQFLATLSQKMTELGREFAPLALSGAESRDMLTLFQKIGFTAARSRELLSTLEGGGTATVWEAIRSQLAQLPEGATVGLERSELATLGKVMKLSESGQARLTALLGEASGAELTPGQLSTVMTVLRAEVAADRQVDADVNQALRALVAKGLTDAAERAGLARQAGNRPGNDERNQRVLAQEGRRQRSEEAQGRAADQTGEQGAAERILEADPNAARARRAAQAPAAQAAQGEAAREPREATEGREGRGASGREGQDGRYLADGALRRGASAQGEGAAGGKSDGKSDGKSGDGADAAWRQMWDKVRAEDGARAAQARVDEASVAAARLADVAGLTQATGRDALAGLDRELAARAMRQVESGLLRTLGQNQKQLVLRLDPPELGKLSMVLTVRDGEVSAMFRAETREAQTMLSEQMSQLRTQLEQQGIRVGRMEVQTQLSGDQNPGQWLSAGDHNQAREREEAARRQGLLRQMRGQDQDVAQEMHNEPHTARIARQGLDIIA
ncbi:flagellar hook-length control protein FliK [Desulfocurvus vexinensis]|uniref:flagellar hook-length control protein FliK n=1 Tax=Desulfocurvus vexinensis TaxID=399548 RepID=UPI00048CD6B5|nr:flagellar hook-length control protein FliK [Desulfocurvus vexinensis]